MKRKKSYNVQTGYYLIIIIILLAVYCSVSFSSLSSTWYLPKEGIRRQVWDTLQVMAKYQVVVCASIGEGEIEENPQWDRYIWLNGNATTEELIRMIDFKDQTIKVYAFKALHSRRYGKLFPLLMQNINDTINQVDYHCHDYGQTYPVRDFMVKEYLSFGYYDEKMLYHPSVEQKETIKKYVDISFIDHAPLEKELTNRHKFK